MRYCR